MKTFLVTILISFSFSFSQAQCDADVRTAFGGVSSIMVYNTYITIGTIGDAYANEVYNSHRVVELMKEQTAMLETVSEMLSNCRKVNNNGLTADDIAYIEELIACIGSLKKEAQGLSDYSVTRSEEAQNRYSVNREKAWDQISILLGLDD